MRTYATILLEQQQLLETELDRYSAILNKARRGAMGLTIEEDKTPEWKEAKRLYSICWASYQQVNKQLTKLRKFKGYEMANVPLFTNTNNAKRYYLCSI
jgi:ornithine carbamoyltransferase